MKKLISVLLALMLVFSVTGSCFAETDTSSATRFDPKLADAMKYDSEKFMSTSFNRALVTVLLYLQLSIDKTINADDYTLVDSIVASNEDGIISVACMGDKDTLVILYAPQSGGIASYMTLSITSKSLVESILKEGGNTTVYTNDTSDLKSVLEMLKDIVNNK